MIYIQSQLEKICQSLNHLSAYGYDAEKYSYSLLQQTLQLEYYYCHPKKAYHHVKRPHSHQLAYFNIGRGFPKEMMDGHWCYVIKSMGNKILVVPCTSIKKHKKISNHYEKYIQVIFNGSLSYCCMHLTDMRAIDIQRLDIRKPIYPVITSRKEITAFVSQQLFN